MALLLSVDLLTYGNTFWNFVLQHLAWIVLPASKTFDLLVGNCLFLQYVALTEFVITKMVCYYDKRHQYTNNLFVTKLYLDTCFCPSFCALMAMMHFQMSMIFHSNISGFDMGMDLDHCGLYLNVLNLFSNKCLYGVCHVFDILSLWWSPFSLTLEIMFSVSP